MFCSGGTIDFAGNYTIPLASELAISKNLTITGAGTASPSSGQNAVRVFNVSDGYANVTLDMLTIAGGNAGSSNGGGIYNAGNLTVTNSTFSGNYAIQGGGIYNAGQSDGDEQHLLRQLRKYKAAASTTIIASL